MTPDDAALARRLTERERERNGFPDAALAGGRERAARVAADALGDLLHAGGIRTSPLGPAWSSDVDCHVTRPPEPGRLEARGWIPLDRLLSRIGHPGRGRWAIVEDGEILARADLHLRPPLDPIAALLERCRRRGEVRLREVLELRALVRRGAEPPAGDPAVRAAADVEAALGGDLLARWATGARTPIPAPLASRPIRRALRPLRRAVAPRVVVALSGVDGAGKSTVAELLVRDLARLGVPVQRIWTRPGMRIGPLDRLAVAAKRLLGRDTAPGVLRAAEDPGAALASRRGAVGWAWSFLVTLAFVADVRRRHHRAAGVLVYDRHLLDAQVTLDLAYRGVDLRAHRTVVRLLLPPAALTLYLDVPAELAVARKPGDAFGEAAVRHQLGRYDRELARMRGVRVLDATLPAEVLARRALEALLGAAGSGPSAGAGSAAAAS